MKRFTWTTLIVLGLAACTGGPSGPTDTTDKGVTQPGGAKLDAVLSAALAKGVNPGNAHRAMPRQLVRFRVGHVDGQPGVLVDVFIHGSTAALAKVKALGAKVRTVTSGGIMTATVPLSRVSALAALAEVGRIEAAKPVSLYMDLSTTSPGLNLPAAQRPAGQPATGGAGVVVGVLDTGIDWSHDDFRNEDGSTRVYAVWDQSDVSDLNPPDADKNYGTVYTQSVIQDCINGSGTYCAQADIDGHGTHVAGTAAANGRAFGNGSAKYQFAGIAPESTIVVVKFDFDGDRNTDTAIVDGIDWIFQKAAELGMPAVINLSLGTDFGPHDGSTLEERSISELTGAGRIVVAAAGNPGRTGDDTWGNVSLWGNPMHGRGTIPQDGYSEIVIEVPEGGVGDYVFFTAWYAGGDKTQVQVTTPSGAKYPPTMTRRNKSTWTTGSPTTFYRTSEGSIMVGNGGDQIEWGTNNGDNELYVELSDYDNENVVAAGTWTVRIYDRGISGAESIYHSWHGTSDGLTTTSLTYDGQNTDNTMTVGSPATATGVIAVAAYTTRMGWEYLDLNDTDGVCVSSVGSPCCQLYNDYPDGALSYYDPYFIDSNGNGLFDHDFGLGGHACYLDDPLDTAEPFHTLAFFSARGPSRDGRVKPEISAPGVGIVASLSQDALAAENAAADPNQTYFRRTNRVFADGLHAVLQGTSMACPHGTGSVALLLAANATLNPSEVRNLLQDSARADGFTAATPNDDWGWGKVDVATALAMVPAPPETCTLDSECTEDDGNECTVNRCVAGACVHEDVDEGTACSTGLCCAGQCSAPACTVDTDCPNANETCSAGGTCAAQCIDDTPPPSCGQPGDACTAGADCCSNKCLGKPGAKTCK